MDTAVPRASSPASCLNGNARQSQKTRKGSVSVAMVIIIMSTDTESDIPQDMFSLSRTGQALIALITVFVSHHSKINLNIVLLPKMTLFKQGSCFFSLTQSVHVPSLYIMDMFMSTGLNPGKCRFCDLWQMNLLIPRLLEPAVKCR